jgi:hypothetical protein
MILLEENLIKAYVRLGVLTEPLVEPDKWHKRNQKSIGSIGEK